MSFLNKLRKDKMIALKNKDKIREGVISLIMAPILLDEKENKQELSEAAALKYIKREYKQAIDSLEAIPENREELKVEAKKKIEIIKEYLPEQLSEEEVKKEILIIIEQLNLEKTPQNKGRIIKETLTKLDGKTDGKIVNKIIAELL